MYLLFASDYYTGLLQIVFNNYNDALKEFNQAKNYYLQNDYKITSSFIQNDKCSTCFIKKTYDELELYASISVGYNNKQLQSEYDVIPWRKDA